MKRFQQCVGSVSFNVHPTISIKSVNRPSFKRKRATNPENPLDAIRHTQFPND